MERIIHLIDTISAISTPIGNGGIGIIRMSGPDSIAIAEKIFIRSDKKQLSPIESHRMIYGSVINPDSGKKVDEAMLTVMLPPKSFTKEDVVEISCHGGLYITQKILDLTILEGARLSKPGEFTRRAFLNGRINLTQAEAIIDLINSKSDMSHEAALKMIDNGLAKEISGIKEKLYAVAKELEIEIDFSEENIHAGSEESWIREIKETLNHINRLIKTYECGKVVREGLTIAIVGRPNVGKSSLMNCLLNQDRAIVSEIPGTTRDTIEEKLAVNGVTVQLIDTAGIQDSNNPVELQGIKRSRRKINDSDILLLLLDSSEPLTDDDIALMEMVKKLNKHVVFVINKIDKNINTNNINEDQIRKKINGSFFRISALERTGIEELINELFQEIRSGKEKFKEDVIITRKRHFDILIRTKIALTRGLDVLKNSASIELFAEDLKKAVLVLGEISGDTYTEELLDRIFNEFCIGK